MLSSCEIDSFYYAGIDRPTNSQLKYTKDIQEHDLPKH
jgi:hypothetical protein